MWEIVIWATVVLIAIFGLLAVLYDAVGKYMKNTEPDRANQAVKAAEREHELSIRKSLRDSEIKNREASFALKTAELELGHFIATNDDIASVEVAAKLREIEARTKAFETLAEENSREDSKIRREANAVDFVEEYREYAKSQYSNGTTAVPFPAFVAALKQ
jgi:hypothetical protein